MNIKETFIFKVLKIIFIKSKEVKNRAYTALIRSFLFLENILLRILIPIYYFILKKWIKLYSQNQEYKDIRVLFSYSQFKPFKKRNKNFLATSNYFLLNTLQKTKKTKIYKSFFDDFINRIPVMGDLFIFSICFFKRINYLLLTDYHGFSVKGVPRLYTLRFISDKLNVKIITFWWDTVSDNFYTENKAILKISYKNVYGDTSLIRSFYRSNKEDLNLGPAMDPNLIYPKEINNRDIDVIFLGSIDSYRSYRKEYLDKLNLLKISGYKILIAGGQGERRLTLEEYFSLLGRSKICINFSESSLNKHQLKGRVYEALASKCLLLESENDQTKLFFENNKEFVSFNSADEMINKIKYYLENLQKLVEISEKGYSKFHKEYNYYSYWNKILDF